MRRQSARLADAVESIPERFRNAHKWTWDKKRQRVIDAAVATGGHLLLTGLPGQGKSAIACAILGRRLQSVQHDCATWAEVEDASTIRFISDPDLCRAEAMHPLGSKVDSPMYMAGLHASLLVLDDLGFDLASRRHPGAELVMARYNARRPTIVTTGHTRSVVEERWGGGVGRRIWTQSFGINCDEFPAMEAVR